MEHKKKKKDDGNYYTCAMHGMVPLTNDLKCFCGRDINLIDENKSEKTLIRAKEIKFNVSLNGDQHKLKATMTCN